MTMRRGGQAGLPPGRSACRDQAGSGLSDHAFEPDSEVIVDAWSDPRIQDLNRRFMANRERRPSQRMTTGDHAAHDYLAGLRMELPRRMLGMHP
jgi:hypothetical protein